MKVELQRAIAPFLSLVSAGSPPPSRAGSETCPSEAAADTYAGGAGAPTRGHLRTAMKMAKAFQQHFDDDEHEEKAENLLLKRPAVQIDRPFVIVPGYRTKRSAFDDLIERLVGNGLNGGRPYYVRDGSFFSDKDCKKSVEVPKDAKFFIVVFDSVLEAPDKTVGPLGVCLAAVKKATGYNRLDVDGYSMGGLATRLYLDRGGNDIGKPFLLGVPNRGARLATLAQFVIQNHVKFAMKAHHLTPEHNDALKWLTTDGSTDGNPLLADLNSRWHQQYARVEAMHSVGSKRRVTLNLSGNGLTWGDGVVDAASVQAPVGTVTMLSGKGHKLHGHLHRDPEVYDQMVAFFGWKPVTENDAAHLGKTSRS